MTDDLVVLWREQDGPRSVCCEIVQIAEGEFELRLTSEGRLLLSEDGTDFHDLIARARELRARLHPSF